MATVCDCFKLDTSAIEFGICINCGFHQKEHKVKAADPEFIAKAAKASAEKKAKKMATVCDCFKLDTSATEFGICINCGFHQKEHKVKAADPEFIAKAAKASAEKKAKKMATVCDCFKLDTSATEFGICINCGFHQRSTK